MGLGVCVSVANPIRCNAATKSPQAMPTLSFV